MESYQIQNQVLPINDQPDFNFVLYLPPSKNDSTSNNYKNKSTSSIISDLNRSFSEDLFSKINESSSSLKTITKLSNNFINELDHNQNGTEQNSLFQDAFKGDAFHSESKNIMITPEHNYMNYVTNIGSQNCRNVNRFINLNKPSQNSHEMSEYFNLFSMNENYDLSKKDSISKEITNLSKEEQSSQKKKKFIKRDGDWVCMNCKNKNFSFRIFCNRCKLQKSVSEGLYQQHMMNLMIQMQMNEKLQNTVNIQKIQNHNDFNPNIFSINSSLSNYFSQNNMSFRSYM